MAVGMSFALCLSVIVSDRLCQNTGRSEVGLIPTRASASTGLLQKLWQEKPKISGNPLHSAILSHFKVIIPALPDGKCGGAYDTSARFGNSMPRLMAWAGVWAPPVPCSIRTFWIEPESFASVLTIRRRVLRPPESQDMNFRIGEATDTHSASR